VRLGSLSAPSHVSWWLYGALALFKCARPLLTAPKGNSGCREDSRVAHRRRGRRVGRGSADHSASGSSGEQPIAQSHLTGFGSRILCLPVLVLCLPHLEGRTFDFQHIGSLMPS
jgi:hypothetical protein